MEATRELQNSAFQRNREGRSVTENTEMPGSKRRGVTEAQFVSSVAVVGRRSRGWIARMSEIQTNVPKSANDNKAEGLG